MNDGQQGAISCPQAFPAWLTLAEEFLGGVPASSLAGTYAAIPNITAAQVPKAGATETEDCLFLDVIVPEAIFNKSTAPG